MFDIKKVKVIGFDLDENLYPSNPAINNVIRTEIARGMLSQTSQFQNLKQAREYFDARYLELGSTRKVLAEIGISLEQSEIISDRAATQADIVSLLVPDPKTAEIVRRINEQYPTALITSSTEEMALKKLAAIGISTGHFSYKVYGDTPGAGSKTDGSAFRYLLRATGLPPENHVYIGNSKKADILPAKKVGMQTIAVWSEITEADLSIPNIHALEEVLLNGRRMH